MYCEHYILIVNFFGDGSVAGPEAGPGRRPR